MKLKLIAAAAMFAVAGQASASIANGTAGNGELFLSVFDSVAQTSYVRDLGIDMSTFSSNGSTAGYSVSFAGDALLASAFGSFASNNNLVWNVAALDTTGGTNVGGQHYLSTTNASQTTVQNTSNGKLTNGFIAVNNYVNAINGVDSDSAINNSKAFASADGVAYFDAGFKKNWLGNASFDSTAAVGQSLNFFSLAVSSTSSLGKISATQFGSANGNATWVLGTDGTLNYTVPSAVPVPAAVWLLGSGLIGMVGVARRKVK